MKIRLTTLHCRRCGHRWVPKQREVRLCAKCKSAYFDTPKPKGNRQGLRPQKRKAS